jgi:hypothetical protein
MFTGSSNPVYGYYYGDKKEMKDERQHMHGPTSTTPGKQAARSLCADMCLP